MLFAYPEEFQKKASQEYERLSTDGAYLYLPILIEDYGKTRDTIRKCQKQG